jgi:hypothetical protein
MAAQPRLAFSYRRVSTGAQAGESRSGLERQQVAFDGFCTRHGLQPATAYEDRGLSAFHGLHRHSGAMGAFLGSAREGRVPRGSVLVVENLSRFSREAPSDALRVLLVDFFDLGLALGVCQLDAIVSKDEFDRQIGAAVNLQVAMSLAHHENLIRSDYTKAYYVKIRKDAQRGIKNHHKARTETKRGSYPYWLDFDEDNGDFMPNHHAAMIRRIFELAVSEGSVQIARRLEAEGFRTAVTNQPMRHHQVLNTLNNPQVIGVKEWMNQQRGPNGKKTSALLRRQEGYFPAVVTQKEWDAAHEAMDARRLNKARTGSPLMLNLFQGRTFCAACLQVAGLKSHRIKLAGGRIGEYQYLLCKGHDRGLCDRVNFKYDEEDLLNRISHYRWREFFNDGSQAQAVRAARQKVLDTERVAASGQGTLEQLEANLKQARREKLNPRLIDDLYADIEEARHEHEAAATAAAAAALDLQRLEQLPSGEEAERAIQAKVQEFMGGRRRDLDARRGFNAWLHQSGLLILVDAKDQSVQLAWGEVAAYREGDRTVLDQTVEDMKGFGFPEQMIAARRAEIAARQRDGA